VLDELAVDAHAVAVRVDAMASGGVFLHRRSRARHTARHLAADGERRTTHTAQQRYRA
jgi:hypothetical protein